MVLLTHAFLKIKIKIKKGTMSSALRNIKMLEAIRQGVPTGIPSFLRLH